MSDLELYIKRLYESCTSFEEVATQCYMRDKENILLEAKVQELEERLDILTGMLMAEAGDCSIKHTDESVIFTKWGETYKEVKLREGENE